MQLRGNTRTTNNRSLDITDKDYLDEAIEGLQEVIAESMCEIGLIEVEVDNSNIESITKMLPPFTAFLLGRMVTLSDIRHELYSKQRVLPWVKRPEDN